VLIHYFRKNAPVEAAANKMRLDIAAVKLEEQLPSEGVDHASVTPENTVEQRDASSEEKETSPVKKRDRLRSRGDPDTVAWISSPTARLSMISGDFEREEEDKDK